MDVTICARDFEIHVDLVVEPGAEARADALEAAFLPPIERWLYSRDEEPIEAHVLDLCRERGWTLGTAESCTGGMVAARLTGIPGSSDVFRGGVVAYGNEIKEARARRPGRSARRARRRLTRGGGGDGEGRPRAARRRRRRLGDGDRRPRRRVGGEAGGARLPPCGGPGRGLGREFSFPGDRPSIRARSVVGALHLVRRLAMEL